MEYLMRGRTFSLLMILFAVVAAFACCAAPNGDPAAREGQAGLVHSEKVEYRNRQYRFRLALPDDWKGFSVLTETWTGSPMVKGVASQSGPLITVRHPLWTEEKPYQDIPIMVFTKEQWSHIDDLAVSPAPVGPGRIGSNRRYVFAVPPRYVGYTDFVGWQVVEEWMRTNPFHGL